MHANITLKGIVSVYLHQFELLFKSLLSQIRHIKQMVHMVSVDTAQSKLIAFLHFNIPNGKGSYLRSNKSHKYWNVIPVM